MLAGANDSAGGLEVREPLPERGLLVPGDVRPGRNVDATAVLDALRESATPIAFDYRPVAPAEISTLPTVKVNASAQQAMSEILRLAGPKSPTLYTAVLPEGSQLARAAGGGFRGFAKAANGRISASAVLKPVGVGAAAATAWPVIATAATVMVLDHVAQRQQRAFQQRVTQLLERQEARAVRGKFASIQAVGMELCNAIAAVLDGHSIVGSWEHARLRATEELIYARRHLTELSEAAGRAIRDGGADYKRLSELLGGARKSSDAFFTDFELARGAIAVGGKAALVDAAANALRELDNPYTALRAVLESRFAEVEAADAQFQELGETLLSLELTTDHLPWFRGEEKEMQKVLRAGVSRSLDSVETQPLQFLALPSGELLQVQAIESRAEPDAEPETAPSS